MAALIRSGHGLREFYGYPGQIADQKPDLGMVYKI